MINVSRLASSDRAPRVLSRLRARRAEAGVSFLGLVFWVVVLGFFVYVGMKLLPIYLNQLKVSKAVEEAAKAAKGPEDVPAVKRTLERIWGVDDIEHLDYKDVVVSRNTQGTTSAPAGLLISYDYEVRENLVGNIDIVVHFKKSVPAGPGAGTAA